MRTLMNLILRKLHSFSLIRFLALYRSRRGALGQIGWKQSNSKGLLFSGRDPKPWFVYGSIDYIEHTIPPTATVLELGGGGSTLFWTRRGNPVLTIETDPKWIKKIKAEVNGISGWNYVLINNITPESLSALNLEKFDVIVNDFDGDRAAVAEIIIRLLNHNGYIIWDNSDRRIYKSGLDTLAVNGFNFISFFGLAPISSYASETKIFSKSIVKIDWPISTKNSIEY